MADPAHAFRVDDRVRWIGPDIGDQAKTGKVLKVVRRAVGIRVQWDDGWTGWARPEHLEFVSPTSAQETP